MLVYCCCCCVGDVAEVFTEEYDVDNLDNVDETLDGTNTGEVIKPSFRNEEVFEEDTLELLFNGGIIVVVVPVAVVLFKVTELDNNFGNDISYEEGEDGINGDNPPPPPPLPPPPPPPLS
jgi:hypothetical protein